MSYVILEWNQASRTPEVIDTDLYDERDDAVEHARSLLAANRSNGRREGYSVHELDDMPEWQDEDDREPARPTPHDYVVAAAWTQGMTSGGSSSGAAT